MRFIYIKHLSIYFCDKINTNVNSVMYYTSYFRVSHKTFMVYSFVQQTMLASHRTRSNPDGRKLL